jgi:hypothetical protein
MTDVAYYQRRLAEELAAVPRASCAKAADAHRELAEIYRRLVESDQPSAIQVAELRLGTEVRLAD